MKRFDITFFFGPTPEYVVKDEVIAEMAASGITLAQLNHDTAVNKAALPIMAKYGIRADVGDPRISKIYWENDTAAADATVKEVVADYAAFVQDFAAAVGIALLEVGHIERALGVATGGGRFHLAYMEAFFLEIAIDFATGAGHMDDAARGTGTAVHGEGAGSAIAVVDEHGLVIHDADVAAVHAAAVGVIRLAEECFLLLIGGGAALGFVPHVVGPAQRVFDVEPAG